MIRRNRLPEPRTASHKQFIIEAVLLAVLVVCFVIQALLT